MFVEFLGGDGALYDQLRADCMSRANPHTLSDDERMALWIYTFADADHEWYRRINGELWGGGHVVSEGVRFLEKLINQGLEKLPCYEGQVYRGYMASDFEAFIGSYDEDIILRYPGLTSTSIERAKAFYGNAFFTIKSQNGRPLRTYAHLPSEEEVLFRSVSRFRVVAMERVGNEAVIELEERPLP